MRGTGRSIATLSLSSILISNSIFSSSKFPFSPHKHPTFQPRVLLGFTPLSSSLTTTIESTEEQQSSNPTKQSTLLEKLRLRHLKAQEPKIPSSNLVKYGEKNKKIISGVVSSFSELGLSDEVIGALEEMGISVPTEIQCIGIPTVLEGNGVVLGSHTGSGKTLA